MTDQLHQGDLLRPVISQANDQSVWVRGPQLAFCGWLQAFDAWIRNQFAGSLDVVRQRVEAYVSAFDNAQQAFANGIPGVALPPPPAPVGAVPPNCPYPFQMQVPKGTNPTMNPDLMRKGLVNALGKAKDDLMIFSGRLGDVLTEPASAPGAATVPGAPPMHHLPPDAKEAAGVPKAYQAIAMELQNALQDVLDRAAAWEKVVEDDIPVASAPSLSGAIAGLGASAGAAVTGSQEAVSTTTSAPLAPEAQAPAPVALPATSDGPPPRTPEEQQAARGDADRLVGEHPPIKVLQDPKELQAVATELKAHENDPDFTAEFVHKFGAKNVVAIPRVLRAWQNGWDRFNVPTDDSHHRALGIGKADRKPSKENVEGVLYSFSATLATATTSHKLPEDAVDDIFKANDPLALSWLLSNHDAHFDPTFLSRAFDVCVRNVIFYEASQRGQNLTGLSRSDPPLQLTQWNLYDDPKVATLNAISRNPDAAAAITTAKYDPPLQLRFGGGYGQVVIENNIELLFQAQYRDHSNCVSRVLHTSYDTLLQKARKNSTDAEGLRTYLKNSMSAAAETKSIPDSSRREIASALANHIGGLSNVVANVDPDPNDPFQISPDLLTPDQVTAAIAQVAHDPKSVATLMVGIGQWVEGGYAGFTKQMEADVAGNRFKLDEFVESMGNENIALGKVFCSVVQGIRDAGIQDRKAALATLASFHLGVDIVFDVAKKIPIVGDVSGEIGKIPGGLSSKGEDQFKDNIASWLSGVDKDKEAARAKRKAGDSVDLLDAMLIDKAMAIMASEPVLLSQIGVKWPDFMLADSTTPPPAPQGPTDREYLRGYMKPEYLKPDGGVRFPGPGESSYKQYERWRNNKQNKLAERADSMTDKARTTMRGCMTKIGWADAAAGGDS